jgi:hypothetical protein
MDAATLEYKFTRLVAEPVRLRAMGEAARRIATPGAAAAVVALLCAAT